MLGFYSLEESGCMSCNPESGLTHAALYTLYQSDPQCMHASALTYPKLITKLASTGAAALMRPVYSWLCRICNLSRHLNVAIALQTAGPCGSYCYATSHLSRHSKHIRRGTSCIPRTLGIIPGTSWSIPRTERTGSRRVGAGSRRTVSA